MKHLLVAVHGSRRESSNDELRLLGAKVSASVGVAFDGVKVAFLEFASPSVEAALVDFLTVERQKSWCCLIFYQRAL